MKVQFIVKTTTNETFISKIEELNDLQLQDTLRLFRELKDLKNFAFKTEDDIKYYFHPNQIVAIGIKVVED